MQLVLVDASRKKTRGSFANRLVCSLHHAESKRKSQTKDFAQKERRVAGQIQSRRESARQEGRRLLQARAKGTGRAPSHIDQVQRSVQEACPDRQLQKTHEAIASRIRQVDQEALFQETPFEEERQQEGIQETLEEAQSQRQQESIQEALEEAPLEEERQQERIQETFEEAPLQEAQPQRQQERIQEASLEEAPFQEERQQEARQQKGVQEAPLQEMNRSCVHFPRDFCDCTENVTSVSRLSTTIRLSNVFIVLSIPFPFVPLHCVSHYRQRNRDTSISLTLFCIADSQIGCIMEEAKTSASQLGNRGEEKKAKTKTDDLSTDSMSLDVEDSGRTILICGGADGDRENPIQVNETWLSAFSTLGNTFVTMDPSASVYVFRGVTNRYA